MQIKNYPKKSLGWILRLVILLACGWFIYAEVQGRLEFSWVDVSEKWPVILVVLVLMPVNWWLEIWRWKLSLEDKELSGWGNASRQVLMGLALNWIVPFTGGDVMARIFPNQDKKRAALMLYYNRALMLFLTVLLGAFGVYVYSSQMFNSRLWVIGVIVAGLVALAIVLQKLLAVEKLPSTLFRKLVLLSVARFSLFTLQFIILLQAFIPEIGLMVLLAGVGWVFLFRSFLPSLFGNLGVREASALLFFEPLVADPSRVLIPAFLIWIINTVVPSFVGMVLLMRNKKPQPKGQGLACD